jgi:lysophospholipase L1-like esterase
MDIERDDMAAARHACDAAIRQQRWAEAAPLARRLAENDPTNLRYRQQLAHLLLLAGDLTAARAEAEALLALQPDHAEALRYLAHIEATDTARAERRAVHRRMVEALAGTAPQILFAGDSLTLGWQFQGRASWDRYFVPLSAANIGLAGDTTRMLLWRIENGAVDPVSPRLVVLMIGTNDLPGDDVASIVQGIEAVVQAITKRLPNARLLLLGLLPRDAARDTVMRRKAIEVNARIKSLADDKTIVFAEFGDALLEADGSLSEVISPDALHLSADGYARLAVLLYETIRAMPGA